MTVLIAIPYWRVAPELIDNAVIHALAQTADSVVLVAGDGQKPPISVRDSRLVVGTFPTNMGAPATQQAMLLGSPFPWYAPHGADDWIEPDHIAQLAALGHQAGRSGRIWQHRDGQEPVSTPAGGLEVGLFDTRLLKSIGGYNAAERCGQDSVVVSLLRRLVGTALTEKPTYHRLWRADSLTHDPPTKHGSPYRVAVQARNAQVLTRCNRLGRRNARAIRDYRETLVPADVRSQVEGRAAEVAKWLA